MKGFFFKTRKEWRKWLRLHHNSKNEVWLIFYKKETGYPTISYNDAVEEAVCWGWIDGQVKKVDDERFMQRYTPRRAKSLWAESNIKRAKKMIRQGQMTPSGLKLYREAMKEGRKIPTVKNFTVPAYLKTALIKNKKAWANFKKINPSAQLYYVYWVDSAKTEKTRQKRIKKTIDQLKGNKKPGAS